MKKLIVGITAPGSVILIAGQLRYFKDLGYQTYLMAPNHERVIEYCRNEGCIHLPVDLEREISLLKDLKALYQVIRHLRKVKPDVVNFGTPKVSLLGMIGGFFTGIKKRVYTIRGFRFESEKGIKKMLLIKIEKLTVSLSTEVVCISPSVKEKAIKEKIISSKKAIIIGRGSSNGIDRKLFNPNCEKNLKISRELSTIHKKNNELLILFVGRVNSPKGIEELYESFLKLYDLDCRNKLLIIGSLEENQIINKEVINKIIDHPAIELLGSIQQNEVPAYMLISDIFVLPSWGEGFGNVLIQAASMGVPVISTYATGVKDAVANDFNGILVPPKNKDLLFEAIFKLINDIDLRVKMGKNGQKWAENFDNKFIWKGLDDLYRK